MAKRASNAPDAVVAWLREHAVPLAGVEPEDAPTDLAPLREMIGGARVVALGEATHGTHEFFTLKHRLLRFLVTELEFDQFAIEASWAECGLIDAYVQGGEGNARDLLSGLGFWTWNTREMLDLIDWLRAYNAGPGNGRRVTFAGFDIQQPRLAIEQVLDFIARVDPAALQRARRCYALFLSTLADFSRPGTNRRATREALTEQMHAYHSQSAGVRERGHRGLRAVEQRLEQQREAYIARSSPEAYARARQGARLAVQSEEMFAATPNIKPSPVAMPLLALHGIEQMIRRQPNAIQLRDTAMAETVSWQLAQSGPASRITLWAHNGHVMTLPSMMGSHLRREFGRDLVVTGFTFHHGAFTARDFAPWAKQAPLPTTQQIGAPRPDSLEAACHATGLSTFVVDLRTLPRNTEAGRWLRTPRHMRSIGGTYMPNRADVRLSAPELMDLLVYVDESTPSMLLDDAAV